MLTVKTLCYPSARKNPGYSNAADAAWLHIGSSETICNSISDLLAPISVIKRSVTTHALADALYYRGKFIWVAQGIIEKPSVLEKNPFYKKPFSKK